METAQWREGPVALLITLRALRFPSEIVLKETKFSFAVTFNWRWFLGWGGDMCVPLLSVLGPHYAGCLSLCNVPQTCWLRGPCFLGVLHLLLALKLLPPPLPQGSLNPGGRDFMNTFHLGQSVPRSLTLCMLSGNASLQLFQSATGGSFADGGWAKYWSMGTAEIMSILNVEICFLDTAWILFLYSFF